MFESLEQKAFFKALGYTPPVRQTLASTVLDRYYDKVKDEVIRVLNSSSTLGLVVDESSNISGNRIENVSVICKGTAYHWRSSNIEDRDATADATIELIKNEAIQITKGRLNRVSSISTDTCSTQRALQKKIH